MKAKIALVDDDRNVLASVGAALESEGYEVTKYTDGDQALRGMGTNPVDLAVLDIKMPRMDGMELLRRIRQTSDLPVIFLTTKNDEIDDYDLVWVEGECQVDVGEGINIEGTETLQVSYSFSIDGGVVDANITMVQKIAG